MTHPTGFIRDFIKHLETLPVELIEAEWTSLAIKIDGVFCPKIFVLKRHYHELFPSDHMVGYNRRKTWKTIDAIPKRIWANIDRVSIYRISIPSFEMERFIRGHLQYLPHLKANSEGVCCCCNGDSRRGLCDDCQLDMCFHLFFPQYCMWAGCDLNRDLVRCIGRQFIKLVIAEHEL